MSDLYSYIRGFTFNNTHNYDITGVVMRSKSIQPPSKKKIQESVPFMNGSYDFSTVGTNGEITYEERELTVVLGLLASTKEGLQNLYSTILGWLLDAEKSPLIFDDILDCYYMAEVKSISSMEQVMTFGELTVTFSAYPFKYSLDYVGDTKWDRFNFETDVLTTVEFYINTSRQINVYNPGRSVSPIVNCSANMTVVNGDYTANFVSGNNIDWRLVLQYGCNTLNVTGDGYIKFIFRKELL